MDAAAVRVRYVTPDTTIACDSRIGPLIRESTNVMLR
jgi:hypothetical protein